jgi:hypothetical protein
VRGFCLIPLTGREKKKFLSSTIYFSFIHYICTLLPPKQCYRTPPGVPLIAYPLHAPLRHGHLFLVGCCVLICQLAANLRHRVYYFHYFCVAPFDVPNNGTAFPHALHPPRATSPDSLSSLMPTLGWLLGLPFKFWPLKAKATPITLFFDGACVGAPNKGKDCSAAKDVGMSLAWTRSKTLR